MLAGTLHGTLSKDNYRGSGSADVTVKGPFGLDHFLGQDGGALSWSGAWTGNPGVPGGGCTGAGSFKATAMSIFGDNGGNGLTPADAGPIYYPELKISDGPVSEVGGPVEHGQELIVEIYASELVDATCDVTYPPGQTLEITTQTCAGGLILQLAGPGRFTGSCHSEDGSGIIDWTGEIHQVSP